MTDQHAHHRSPKTWGVMTPLKEARLSRGLRQCDVARRIGVSDTKWNAIECGRRPVPPEIVRAVSDLLGIEVPA